MLSPRRSGTTSSPQDSRKDKSAWPHVTNQLVFSTLLTVWEVVSSPPPLLIATQRPIPGERLSSNAMKSRDLIATLTSTVWILPEIRHAPWSRNGTPLLRLSFKLRPPMVTSSECSLLLSLTRPQDKLKPHATPRLPTKNLSERRWWRSCSPRSKSLPLKSSSRPCK